MSSRRRNSTSWSRHGWPPDPRLSSAWRSPGSWSHDTPDSSRLDDDASSDDLSSTWAGTVCRTFRYEIFNSFFFVVFSWLNWTIAYAVLPARLVIPRPIECLLFLFCSDCSTRGRDKSAVVRRGVLEELGALRALDALVEVIWSR